MEWIQYVPTIAPWSLLLFVIGYVFKRLRRLEDVKVEKELFEEVESKVAERLEEVKKQNGDLHKKIDSQQVKITEISTDLKWIKNAIIKNNGGGTDG